MNLNVKYSLYLLLAPGIVFSGRQLMDPQVAAADNSCECSEDSTGDGFCASMFPGYSCDYHDCSGDSGTCTVNGYHVACTASCSTS